MKNIYKSLQGSGGIVKHPCHLFLSRGFLEGLTLGLESKMKPDDGSWDGHQFQDEFLVSSVNLFQYTGISLQFSINFPVFDTLPTADDQFKTMINLQ